MVLHGVLVPDIRRKNTLEEDIRNVANKYDIILTNPPFGGKENKQIQKNFPVSANATELLFLEHIIKKLKADDNARCGMVVPEGTLFRSGAFGTVKEWLLNDFNLVMVVSLPPGTFAAYSDVKAALLFFERGKQGDEVLYQEVVLPEELKKFSKGNPIDDSHFGQVREIWQQMKAYQQGKGKKPEVTEFSWFEKTEDLIKRGFDLSAKNPNTAEREKLAEPSVLLDRIISNNEKLQRIVARIESLLGQIKHNRLLLEQMRQDTEQLLPNSLDEVFKKLDSKRQTLLNVIQAKPRNGWSPECDNNPDGTPVLKLGAVLRFQYNPDEIKRTSLPTNSKAHYWLEAGDFLISRSNTLELVGHASIYSGIPYPCIYPDTMMRFKVNPMKADSKFLLYWLQSKEVRNYIQSKASGASPTMKKIRQDTVCNIP